VIDVEQCGLRAFKQNGLTASDQAIQQRGRVHNEWTQPIAETDIGVADGFRVYRLRTAQRLQDAILLFNLGGDFLREAFQCDQVADTEATTARLVFVCGADAPRGRSDLSIAKQLFRGRFNGAMVGKNQMTPIGNEKPSGNLDAGGGDGIGFLKECDWIQNHASADDADHSVVKYSGRNQVKHVAILSKRDCVAGIVSALVTGNTVEFLREDVDDFAFAFISPLETYDC
jgi:hypothetical protein